MPTHSLFPLKPDAHQKVKLHSRTKCTRKYQYMRVFECTGCSTSFSIFRYTVKFSSSTSNESKTISLLFCLSDLLQGVMRNVIAFRSCLTLDRSLRFGMRHLGLWTSLRHDTLNRVPCLRASAQNSAFPTFKSRAFLCWKKACFSFGSVLVVGSRPAFGSVASKLQRFGQ